MSFQNFFKAAAVCLLLLTSLISYSQDRVISGRVTDQRDGSGLQGVTVSAKGTRNATQTAADGSFRISIAPSVTTMVFSSVGFATHEVTVSSNTSIDVSLGLTNASMGEVVVVAYGTRRRADLTGAVTSISAKDFQKGNIASSEQLLQGKVAGLQITSGGGSAGGGSRIRIRGGASLNASNDPLIVIDGVPVESNGLPGSANYLNTINPDDIESISVLKDASATALYGSRASNGVLIITTKKGVPGKLKFNFNTQFSVSKIGETVDVLTGDEIRAIVTAQAAATGNNTWKNLLGTANTDWQDQIYRTAFGTTNNISASGSVHNTPFRASLGYLNQGGILKTDNFNRFSASLNLSPKFLNDHLSVNLALKASHTQNRFADGGAIGNAVTFDPTQPVFDNNSHIVNYGGYYEWRQPNDTAIALSNRNPLSMLEQRDNRSKVNRLIANIQLDYKLHFFPDLHLQANLGLDNAYGRGDDVTDSTSANAFLSHGRRAHYEQRKKNYLADVSLFYAKEIKSINSRVDVLVGHSFQDFIIEVTNFPSFSLRGTGPNDTIPGSVPTFKTDKPQYRLESYLGRINFTLANKYLLTASVRRDASSKFSPETRVGYFPAAALAWRIKEEFFKTTNILSDLKLRLGWGETGQQDGIPYYPYLPRYAQSNLSAQYQFGNTFYTFLRPSEYDANIKWETTETINLGLDFGFLNNRISGSVDLYKKKTKDLLSAIPVAPGSNFNIILLTNVGNMENKGIEFTMNTVPVQTKDLTWNFGFNLTFNKSEITNLLKQPDPNFKGIPVSGISGGTGNNIGKFTVGYAPYTFFVYKQIYDKSNKPIEGLYEDINRDGSVDDDDRYLYKKPSPDALLGINTSVNWKKWSFGAAAHGAFGNYLYNNYQSNAGVLNAIQNPINFIGNASANYRETQFVNNRYLSDYYIENASFLRLDNINFGYNWGRAFNDRTSLRLLASIQNVFVISKYTGLDPENASNGGIDNNIYPRPRIFSIGANLDF